MVLGRLEYWSRTIGVGVLWWVLSLLSVVVFEEGAFLVLIFGALAMFVCQTIWSVQRFHDVGLSGVWLLLQFVPGFGSIAIFIVLLLPTDTFDTYDKGYNYRIEG